MGYGSLCLCICRAYYCWAKFFSASLFLDLEILTSQALKDGDFMQLISLMGELHFWKQDEQIA